MNIWIYDLDIVSTNFIKSGVLRISDFSPDNIMTPTKEIIEKVVDEIDPDELIELKVGEWNEEANL